jgi:hypothetical protein
MAQRQKQIDVLVRDGLFGHLLVCSAQERANVVSCDVIKARGLRCPVQLAR